jgi:hypothetical protein
MRRRLAASLFAALERLQRRELPTDRVGRPGHVPLYRPGRGRRRLHRRLPDLHGRVVARRCQKGRQQLHDRELQRERWAEKVRLSKVKARTRIVLSGDQALVYDGGEPETALYAHGQWVLAEVPELTTTQSRTATR